MRALPPLLFRLLRAFALRPSRGAAPLLLRLLRAFALRPSRGAAPLLLLAALPACLPFVTPPVRAGLTMAFQPTSYAEMTAGTGADAMSPRRLPWDLDGGYVYALQGGRGNANVPLGQGGYVQVSRRRDCEHGKLPLRFGGRGEVLTGPGRNGGSALGYGVAVRVAYELCDDELRMHGAFSVDRSDGGTKPHVVSHLRGVGAGAFDFALHAQAGVTFAPDGSQFFYVGLGGDFQLGASAGVEWSLPE